MATDEGRVEGATGGLAAAAEGGTAGQVPLRTDDAVGASAEIRAAARPMAPISERTRSEARHIITRYPRGRSALLPMLHLVQSEQGYVTPEGVAMCAEELGLTKAEVGAVATFYTMYKRRPTGDYLVSVCTNTLCGFLGGEEIFTALKDHLGVGHDQTTADGQITLEHAECLAACDYAPVVTVNYEFYDQQDADSALGLVRDLQAGQRPAPTRGAPLCSFREISRQLAGFYDPATLQRDVDGPSALEPTVAGNRLAVQRGDEAPGWDPDTPIVPPPPPESVTQQSPEPADPEPKGGQTAHKTSTDEAVAAADTPAEEAGAAMADPDTNREVLTAGSGSAPPATPAAADAGATGAPSGLGSTAPPQARRTRTRTRPGGQAEPPSAPPPPPGKIGRPDQQRGS